MLSMDHYSESAKQAIDAVSVITVIGTLMEVLPTVAAAFTIVWSGIRIYESDTFQHILKHWKDKDDAE